MFGRVRVVLVIAEDNKRAESWLHGLEQVDQQRDVLDLLAHVARDAQQVGCETLQGGSLRAQEPLVAAAHVQVADVDDRHIRPRARQAQTVAFEDRTVRLAKHGVDETKTDQRKKPEQGQEVRGRGL